MVNKCCAPGCKSNYVSKKGTTKVTTFLLQKKVDLRQEWLKKIPRDFTITNNTVICVEHFEEDDIIRYKTQHQPEGKHLRNY